MGRVVRHGALSLLIVAALAAGQEERPEAVQAPVGRVTWAVLASDELRKAGLDDLVLAELAADESIALVDRQHLALVVKERALGDLSDANATSSRRKAGAIVKADTLAILDLESVRNEQFVRLVVAETQTGARLLVEQVAWDIDRPDGAAKAIVAAVQAASRRFPRRVERVYAVLPLVSRNLSHEYDYLQRACASLLADALRSQDGVAVVEIEEARQIAREIAMTDGKEIRPIVPLIIGGEFQVAREALNEEPVVRFDIRVQGNEGPINLPSHAISLSAMPRYLARDLPARILGSPFQDDAPLTLDQQVSALVARANVFADLGAWEHSTSLREAALLLKDNPDDRLRLISEYRRMAQAPLPTGVVKHSQSHAAECARRLRLWACTLPHVAFLIRNKQLEAPEAVALLRPLMHFEQMYHVRNDASPEDMELAEKARRQFVRSVYTPLLEQAAATKYPRLAHDAIESLIIDNRRFDRFDREYLDLIYELFEHATPDEVRCRPPLFCPTFGWDFEQCDEATIRNGLEFYGRLARSERLDNQLTGRLGLLCLEWTRGGSPEVFLRRAETLAEQFVKEADFAEANVGQRHILTGFQQRMRAAMKPPTPPPSRPAHARPEPPPAKPAPQVGYEPLDLSVKTLRGRLQPVRHMRWNAVREVWNPALRLINCGEVDFYWREGVLLMHRQELLLEEILVEPEAVFSDAAWDGVYLWLAATSGSIRLLDKTGKEVVRVQAEHGLPECDRTLKVYPLGQAQAIAAGSFGRHGRMWIGIVDAAGATPKVTVFHQATRLKDATKTTSDEGADLVACPSWIQEYPYPKGHPRLILIGRGGHSHALAVDMQTRDVTVYDPGPTNVESTSFCRYGNCLLYAVQQVPMMIGDTIPDYLGAPSGHSMHPTHILNWNGYLYVTGSPWHRIDPAIWRAEPLIPEQAPVSGHARWGVSVLHGIVCWGNQNSFFRVIIKHSPHKAVPKQTPTDGQQASPPAFEPRFFREPR